MLPRNEPFQRLGASFSSALPSEAAPRFPTLPPARLWPAVLAPTQPFQRVRRRNLSQNQNPDLTLQFDIAPRGGRRAGAVHDGMDLLVTRPYARDEWAASLVSRERKRSLRLPPGCIPEAGRRQERRGDDRSASKARTGFGPCESGRAPALLFPAGSRSQRLTFFKAPCSRRKALRPCPRVVWARFNPPWLHYRNITRTLSRKCRKMFQALTALAIVFRPPAVLVMAGLVPAIYRGGSQAL